MMTSQSKARDILEHGGAAVNLVREFLQLKIREDKEALVDATVESVPQLQGRIKAYRDFLDDLTPPREPGESRNPY